MPRILLTNDDGIHAPGLMAARRALEPLGELLVLAPLTEQSACSHALTLNRPMRLREVRGHGHAVDGTPADCVLLASEGVLGGAPPDLVVSGINAGGNLGQDVAYSGTVGAAMEAAFRSIPALAISQVGYHDLDYTLAARFLAAMVGTLLHQGLPVGTLLNVNVPKHPTQPTRYRVTRLGRHGYRDVVAQMKDPRGRPILWLGGSWAGFEPIEGSDCVAIDAGLISVSPLRMELCPADLDGVTQGWEVEGFDPQPA